MNIEKYKEYVEDAENILRLKYIEDNGEGEQNMDWHIKFMQKLTVVTDDTDCVIFETLDKNIKMHHSSHSSDVYRNLQKPSKPRPQFMHKFANSFADSQDAD
jgi:hypothetical protein